MDLAQRTWHTNQKTMQPLRGFRDIFGPSFEAMNLIKTTSQAIAQQYGYQGIELPVLEETSIFARGLGDTSDVVNKEMYTFLDRNKESITLRPEGTAGAVRAFITNNLSQDLPQKLYYVGPMFRYDRPQKGRYRQFFQFGVECFGSKHPFVDAESIMMGAFILDALDCPFKLEINTLGDAPSRQKFNEALQTYFQKFKNDLSEDSQTRLYKNPLRILDSKDAGDQRIAKGAPSLKDYLSKDAQAFFDSMLSLLNVPFTLNPTMVRGLDYYDHTIFEFKTEHLGAQDAILAGGRYDRLVALFGGPETPAVGWSLGVDRITLLIEDRIKSSMQPVIIIPFEENCVATALQIAEVLRRGSVPCEISYRQKIAKDLRYADKKNAAMVLLIGENELNQQSVTVKHLKTDAPNVTVKQDKILQFIKKC